MFNDSYAPSNRKINYGLIYNVLGGRLLIAMTATPFPDFLIESPFPLL
jgi:hypothetical protein